MERTKRFAQLRAAYPETDDEEIMSRIHDEEVEDAEIESAGRCPICGSRTCRHPNCGER